MVENHYDFVNVHSHRSSADVERTLKSLAAVGKTVDGIDLPSADFNALFVIRHIAAHFAAEGMNLRQLLDWALFVRGASAEVDWKAAWECYRRWNMHRFVLCIDEIAVRRLGFERGIFGIPEEFADFGASDAAWWTGCWRRFCILPELMADAGACRCMCGAGSANGG